MSKILRIWEQLAHIKNMKMTKYHPIEQLIRRPIAQEWKRIREILRKAKEPLPAQNGKHPKRGIYGQSNN